MIKQEFLRIIYFLNSFIITKDDRNSTLKKYIYLNK